MSRHGFSRAVFSALLILTGLVLAGCKSTTSAEDDWTLACHLVTFDAPEDLLTYCARQDGDELVINPDVLAAIKPDQPVEHLMVENQWFLARTGRAVAVLTYDNGPDYFQEGLARIKVHGQIGFVDKALNVVIEPAWDFAFPFQGGLAVVCTGCVEMQHGEHTLLEGGGWGYIDADGRILAEPNFTRDTLPAGDSIKPDRIRAQ